MTIVINVSMEVTPYPTIHITIQYIDQHTVYCHFFAKNKGKVRKVTKRSLNLCY